MCNDGKKNEFKPLHFENKDFTNEHRKILDNLTDKLCESENFSFAKFEKVIEEFKEEAAKLEYRDPDATDSGNDYEQLGQSSYYNWLTRFLNEKALECFKNKIINKNLLFVPPEKAGNVEEGDFWNFPNPPGGMFRDDQDPEDFKELRQDPSKILVYVVNKDGKVENPSEPYLRLTSDQLGFSAIDDGLSKWPCYYLFDVNKKHPLYRLFRLALDEGKSKRSTMNKFISEFIYSTRTLGGAFVWPTNDTEKDGDRKCIYNIRRGSNSYIEDRADLTLLEVKCYYEEIEKDDLILKVAKDQQTYKFQMYKFLELFRGSNGEESFRNFVEFFILDAFVDKNQNFTPKNIMNPNVVGFAPPKFDKKRGKKCYNIGDPLSERELSAEGLMKILKRVQNMVQQRTLAMEKIVAPKN